MSGNFDRIAFWYRWMEYASFGPFLERCRFSQIEHLGKARRALVLGDGDGRFLARLLAMNPLLTADVVDSSRAMLRLLERRVERLGAKARDRIRLHHQDALSWQPEGSYDLIVSHFFLDCFSVSEIEELLDHLIPHLRSRDGGTAQWLVSEFCMCRQAPASHLSRGVVDLLYRSFGLLTGLSVRQLPDYARILEKRGLALHREESFLGGMLHSQLWLLHETTDEPAS